MHIHILCLLLYFHTHATYHRCILWIWLFIFTPSDYPSTLPCPDPPTSASHPLIAMLPLSSVWLLILAKRTDQIFLLPCIRLSVGASQIWWLWLTDGRRPQVLKFVIDSSGFDSPRSSHTRSLKAPGAEKMRRWWWWGVKEERVKKKARASGEQSICGVVRAGGGCSSRGCLKFTHGPPLHFVASFLPFHFFLPCKPSDSLAPAFFCPFIPSLWWYPRSTH